MKLTKNVGRIDHVLITVSPGNFAACIGQLSQALGVIFEPPLRRDDLGVISAISLESGLEAAQYDFRLVNSAMYGRVEYSYQSKTYFDPTNVAVLSQSGYGLWNGVVGYQSADSPWKFQALVKNLTNKQYLITAAAPGTIPTGDAGPPRTVWITAARQW